MDDKLFYAELVAIREAQQRRCKLAEYQLLYSIRVHGVEGWATFHDKRMKKLRKDLWPDAAT